MSGNGEEDVAPEPFGIREGLCSLRASCGGGEGAFSGEPEPFSEKHAGDHDAIESWARAEGVDLKGEVRRTREKLIDVG